MYPLLRFHDNLDIQDSRTNRFRGLFFIQARELCKATDKQLRIKLKETWDFVQQASLSHSLYIETHRLFQRD